MRFIRLRLRAPVLPAIALAALVFSPDPAAAQDVGGSVKKYTARERYFEPTDEDKANPRLPGAERARVLRRRASLRLVVMISAQLSDAPTLGAGIIFGRAKSKLYVVTANHVVRRSSVVARDIKVKLRDTPDTLLRAEVTPHFNPASDVAVLEVDLQASGQFDPCSLVLFQLSEGQHLKRGDIVVALGNPQGIGWGMSVTPEAIGSVEHDKLLFQSTFLSPGHSGGALLDWDGRIIGMIQSDQQPYGVARRLSAIIPELRSWNYVVELYQESPMPKYPRYLFESVLEEAVAQGDLTVVNKLAEACPLDDFGFGRTPLHIGAMHGQTGVVSRLLALGANPNVRANDYAINGYTPLHLAAEHGHAEVVEVLLAAGADAKISTRSQTPVHLAVESGHIDVVKALARNQGLVEKEGLFGRTPLALAITKKRLDIIAALLAAGASPNARDQEGRTPLHIAVRNGVFDALPMLLQAGADAEATDAHGKKPLDMVSDRVKRREVAEMFRTAERDKRRQR